LANRDRKFKVRAGDELAHLEHVADRIRDVVMDYYKTNPPPELPTGSENGFNEEDVFEDYELIAEEYIEEVEAEQSQLNAEAPKSTKSNIN